jgi:hypothetical protein
MPWKMAAVLGRCLAVALGAFAGLLAGGALIRALGMPLPALPSGADATQILLMKMVGAFAIGLLLFPLARRLTVPTPERALVLFVALWGIQGPIQAGEAALFTTFGGGAGQLLIPATGDVALAALLAALFPPRGADRRLSGELRAWLVARPAVSWLWRIAAAGALYLPAYWAFGMLAYAVTHPYYEDPTLGLGLRVPPAEAIVALELGRGVLFILALLPLVMLLRTSRWVLAGWLWLVLALLAGWEPLVTATFLPPVVRLVHGAEITADALAQALTIAALLGDRRRAPEAGMKKGLANQPANQPLAHHNRPG